ncbi:unnamed protein product [Ciceribacter selenitireducens ATCC BAA-1503]|uniref:Uncharacterized protein n=1 Tax=Ciceribacter selenitireducens ATCC BAA-1503 TaxID=1336235 RepID=A0A376AKK8_9HYPH|nr:unnamed protein product [Ciceribacter selenitireducens ATCC BAA-1503]
MASMACSVHFWALWRPKLGAFAVSAHVSVLGGRMPATSRRPWRLRHGVFFPMIE